MVLHTIIDMNDIFATSETSKIECKNVNSIYYEGIKTKDGIRINRIISTNPKDYLYPKYKLGEYL